MHRLLVCLLALAVGLSAQEPTKPKYNLRTMTAEEVDKAAAGQKRYDFDIAAEDGLTDSTGRLIRAADLPAYLKEQALDRTAFYFLWITPASVPMNLLAPTIKPLGDYGITMIVVRHHPEAVKNNRTMNPTPADVSAAAAAKTVNLLVGKPNPGAIDASAPFPDLSGRPAELRPEPLPPRIRYKFAPDATVAAAARRADDLLLAPDLPAGAVLAKSAMIQPGYWKHLQDAKTPFKSPRPYKTSLRTRDGVITLDGGMLNDEADVAVLFADLRQRILSDGGGRVRALRADEMTRWWPFIGFDIEEPIFILETTGGRYRLLLAFSSSGLILVDDLNGLPPL